MSIVRHDPATGRFHLLGGWTVGSGSDIMKEIESRLGDLAGEELLLDFSGADTIDSSGISDLIQLNIRLRPMRMKIVAEKANAAVGQVIRLCKLDRIVTLRD